MALRLSRKTKKLFISFALLFMLGASTVTSTLAWFAVRHMGLQETDFVSGEMGIQITSVTSYKYVYPVYPGTTMINYDSPLSEVLTSDVTGVSRESGNDYLRLNKLDTTQIYLDNNASSTISESALRPKIASQNTSLVLKVTFTAVNTENVGFSLVSVRDAADNFNYLDSTSNIQDSSLLASDFLCFESYLDPDLSSIDPGEGEDLDDLLWAHFRSLHNGAGYSSRSYFHQDANSHGTSIEVMDDVIAKNADATPVSHDLYIFIDYEPTHINPYFMEVERLRYSYHLISDFVFSLRLTSEVAS
ncbi:MAG: hypothetical protein J6328_06265 [Bacilli bacterium]|nr:hypothetical protein [Bacilli bacterium]